MSDMIKSSRLYTTAEAIEKFGTPGEDQGVEKQLVTISVPYKLRLYTRGAPLNVSRITCHKLVSNWFFDALKLTMEAYTDAERVKLGLDVYAGCYNPRPIRGGKSWSKHAFAIASDWLPAENGLKTPFSKSTFSRPEYKDWLDCWRVCGFANLGQLEGFERDAMHFEFMKPTEGK
jgi:hypothetical protein